jgi:hypothetical protein
MNKEELLARIHESRGRIESLCGEGTETELEKRIEPHSEWTVKSLIAHVAFWEHATLHVRSGFRNAASLKDVHAINSDLLAKTKDRAAKEVVQEFVRSGEALVKHIRALTDEDLQQPSPWGDGISLIEHLADDTCIHYEEHLQRIPR